jgi:hypothetical protein
VWRIVPAVSDQALLGRLQEGDEAALAVLYERYAAVLYSLALRVVGVRRLAQEVIQDTFLRCWDRAEHRQAACTSSGSHRTGAAPISGGVFGVDARGEALAVAVVPVALEPARAVAVTEEPAPGSPAPTGPHLLDRRI